MSGGIFRQRIVRLRAAETEDKAGNKVLDWQDPDREPIERVSVQPNNQSEDETELGDRRITSFRVITRPGHTPDISSLDRVEYGGEQHKVDGEVGYWPDPYGRDHIEFIIRRVKGG